MTATAVRGWALDKRPRPDRPPSTTDTRRALRRFGVEEVLVFDTETRVGIDQRLLVLSWVLLVDGDVTEEGIAYPDDLTADEKRRLRSWAKSRGFTDSETATRKLWTVDRWLNDRLWKYSYRRQATVAGFNLSFDLSRLALHTSLIRRSFYRGGWTLQFWGYPAEPGSRRTWNEKPHEGALRIRQAPGRHTFFGWTTPRSVRQGDRGDARWDEDGRPWQGRFVELTQAAYAFGAPKNATLAGACAAFGVDFAKDQGVTYGRLDSRLLDYARADADATARLYLAVAAERERHGITADLARLYSPATVAGHYLGAMGITPPMARGDLSPELLGASMGASYGGRMEAPLIGVGVPVVALDLTAAYANIGALCDLWRFWTAERCVAADVAAELGDFLAAHGLADRCFDPATWKRWAMTLVELVPDGDRLPHRVRDGSGEWELSHGPLHSDAPMWWSAFDVIASTVLTGRVPRVLRAIRLEPEGAAGDLSPVTLPSGRTFDPVTGDLFAALFGERLTADGTRRTWAKLTANALAHGLASRFDEPAPGTRPRPVTVYAGSERFPHATVVAERPGPWCWPPMAATVTAGGRLLLALAERVVTGAGGVLVQCHTDSVKIVATPNGGLVPCPGGTERLSPDRPAGGPSRADKRAGGPKVQPEPTDAVRALSWPQVEALRERFVPLAALVPGTSPWKVEHGTLTTPTMALVLSSVSYALYRADGEGRVTEIVSATEHGHLGLHLAPQLGFPAEPGPSGVANWQEDAWANRIELAAGRQAERPEHDDVLAVMKWTMRAPTVHAAFTTAGATPFGFVVTAREANAFDRSTGGDGSSALRLVRAFTRDPAEWASPGWADVRTGEPLTVLDDFDTGLSALDGRRLVRLATIGRSLNEWGGTNPGAGWRRRGGTEYHLPGLLERVPTVSSLAELSITGKETVGMNTGTGLRAEGVATWERRCRQCGAPLPAGATKWCNTNACRNKAGRASTTSNDDDGPVPLCAWASCDKGPDGTPAPARAGSKFCSRAHYMRAWRAGRATAGKGPAAPDPDRCVTPGCPNIIYGADRCPDCAESGRTEVVTDNDEPMCAGGCGAVVYGTDRCRDCEKAASTNNRRATS